MTNIEKFGRALREWDLHRTELAQLSINRADDWRKRTVEYRRLLQLDIARMVESIAALGEDMAEADRRTLRNALSELRSCVAAHQASCPVVSIDPEDAGYDRSVVNLRAVNDRFAGTGFALLGRLAST